MTNAIRFEVPGIPVAKGRPKAGSRQKATDDQISEAYRRLGNCWRVAEEFGMCGQSVHERVARLGIVNQMRVFSDEDRARLLQAYPSAAASGRLSDLAAEMGRTRQFLCRQAKLLGLTGGRGRKGLPRPHAAGAEASMRAKAAIARNGHPRGMAGKTHSAETKALLSAASAFMWASMSKEKKDDFIMRRRIANTAAPRERPEGSWKAGWREIGGVRKYYRSKWEANYAHYLQWLKEGGHIRDWLHEPVTFWFDGIKRGCLSYLPDFWVLENDGKEAYHEVKGWMDDRSKTKIRRMAKYHPKVRLVVIDGKGYAALKKSVDRLVPGWEP